MTTGEMLAWTRRFNQIKGAAQCLKDKRLINLRNDFTRAHEGEPFNKHVGYMFAAISEEIGA